MNEEDAIRELYCRLCNVRGTCERNIKEHLNSKNHRNKKAQMNSADDKQSTSTRNKEPKPDEYMKACL